MERVNTNPHIVKIHRKRKNFYPNSSLPALIYQQALRLPSWKNKAALIVEKIFARNGWSNSWKNGIYDFHHYHSNTHECMAICKGNAEVILGGPAGKKIKLEQGDVLILPAGVAHKCIRSSKDFTCVGAYPQGKDYDILTGKKTEFDAAMKRLSKISIPRKDPLYGAQGFLKVHWNH